MEYRGVYDDGVIRPNQPLDLPNGTEVEFHPVQRRNGKPTSPAPGAISTMSEAEIRAMQERVRKGRSVEELAAEQGLKPARGVDDLRGEWPAGEDIEDFLQHIREARA